MPVLAEIVAAPALAAIAAVIASHQSAEKPVEPCRPPAIRLESANLVALPGPNSLACKEARKVGDGRFFIRDAVAVPDGRILAVGSSADEKLKK